jgi:short-subunit dehydrogenase
MTNPKTVFITGATAGIGRTTALHLASLGHHVIASGRKPTELAKLAAEARGLAGKLDVIPLDVTQPDSIAAAVVEVTRLTGERGLDALINNAGFGVLGPTSEISDAEIRRQYETNVFGLMNVTRAFLPAMRARRAGRIINVSSVGGRITLPYFGVYNSTKYAVESLSDALRYELGPFGSTASRRRRTAARSPTTSACRARRIASRPTRSSSRAGSPAQSPLAAPPRATSRRGSPASRCG